MANTPKKVKDPTEVALSAIQEALNISEQGAENRGNVNDSAPPNLAPPASDFAASPFEPHPAPAFQPIEEPRSPRRAANDDRATIGQMLQALQGGRPARNAFTLFFICSGAWLLGGLILT